MGYQYARYTYKSDKNMIKSGSVPCQCDNCRLNSSLGHQKCQCGAPRGGGGAPITIPRPGILFKIKWVQNWPRKWPQSGGSILF